MPDTLITEDSPTVPYYTDGSTKYEFTTWVNLLRAVGWDAANGRLESGVSAAGGTAGDPLKVTICNFTNTPVALGCKTDNYLYENKYDFGHTTFEFNRCHFKGGIPDGSDNKWGTARSKHPGLKLRFVGCEFGNADGKDSGGPLDQQNLCMSIYTKWQLDDDLDKNTYIYVFDYTFDGCTIHKFRGPSARLFGGSESGNLLVTNCYLDVYINAIVQDKGVSADGQKPTFTVADCTISDRITKNPGWMVGVMNSGFRSYSVSGLKYSDDATVAANRGQPLDVVFYKSFGDGVEDDANRGIVLNSMGGVSTTGRAEFSCEYVPTAGEDYYLFEYLVPVHVTYSSNRGRGTLPAREGYDKRNMTVCAASGSGLTRNGGAFTEWNKAANGSGATVAAGALIAGGGQLGGDVTLYAQYEAPVGEYSFDGETWYAYPTEGKWQAVIDAYREHCKSGASATTELVGGDANAQGTIYVRNIVFDSRDQLSVGKRTWGGKYYICLYTDYLKYTTIRFDNCTFDKMDASYGLFGPGAIGQQLVFVDCDFYEDASTSKYAGPFMRSEQVYPDGATYCYPVDLAFTNCCGGTLSKGGAGIGDLSIVDCSFAVNVNGHIAEGALTCSAVNSFGLPSTCHIENLQPPPGADFKGETGDDNKLYSSWTCSFAKYELSGSEGYVTTAYRSWWHDPYPRNVRGESTGDKDKLNVLNLPSDSVVIEPDNETEERWPSAKRGAGNGVFLEFSLAGPTPPSTLHDFFVKPAGEGGLAANSGVDWDHATTLSSAIAKAADADQPVTIYVKEGTYSEGSDNDIIASITSAHTQPITILGGCTGTTGTDKSRGSGHSVYQPTDASIVTTSRPSWLRREDGANCPLAISQVDVREYKTGAVVKGAGDFSLTNCNFIKNGDTGALYAKLTSGKVSMYGCEFRGNLISYDNWNSYYAPVVVLSDATITHCAFVANGNTSNGIQYVGGLGLGGTGARHKVDFCTFAYNAAKQHQYNGKNVSGMVLGDTANVMVRNSVFANFDDDGRSIRGKTDENGGFGGSLSVEYTLLPKAIVRGPDTDDETSRINNLTTNNIVYGDARLVHKPSVTEGTAATVRPVVSSPNNYWVYSIDPESIDIHLKSAAGHWNGTGWKADTVTSPAIDAGDPDEAYSNEPMPNGGCVNLGYYGNTAQASKSPYARVRLNANGGTPDPDPATVTVTAGQPMPKLVEAQTNITRSGYAFLGYADAGGEWTVSKMTGQDTDIINEGETVWALAALNTSWNGRTETDTQNHHNYDGDNVPYYVPSSIALNGVTFGAAPGNNFNSACDGGLSFNPKVTWVDPQDNSSEHLGNTAYGALMHNKMHESGESGCKWELTLNNLVVGQSYCAQIIVHWSDGTHGSVAIGVRAEDLYPSWREDAPYGWSFVHRFTATETSKTITLYSGGRLVAFNAIQLRKVNAEDPIIPTLYYNPDGTSARNYPAENGPTELYAQWAPVYTITFRANGGTNDDFTHDVALGGELQNATPATPPQEAEGVHFTGYYDINDVQWYDADGKPLADKSPYALSDNLTLYAHWDAKAYYKIGADEGVSSFEKSGDPENQTTPVGWALYDGGTPIVHTVSPDCDYYVQWSGANLVTPEDTSETVHAFAGKSLTIAHAFFVKENVSFGKLISQSGIICNGRDNRTISVSGSLEIPAGQTLELDVTRANRTLDISATVSGGGTIRLMGEVKTEDANGVYLLSGDFSDFTGNIAPYPKGPSNGCSLVFTANEFLGRLEGVPNTMTNVCFNYGALDSSKGLLIGKGDEAVKLNAGTLEPLKTRVTLYSDLAYFDQRFFPLMTFPKDTEVDPAEFTVYHATSANGEKTAFRNLGVRTNGDGTITLVANSVLSAIRESGPEIHFWNLDWIAGVCQGEKTAEEYQAAFLTRNPSGVATWQAYVLGYEPNEVATAAILEESVQNADPRTVTIRLRDWESRMPRTNDTCRLAYSLYSATSTDKFARGEDELVKGLDEKLLKKKESWSFEAPLRDLSDSEPVRYYRIRVHFIFGGVQ